ncbi:MAG: thioredoxin domain-containing protein [Chryseolinea sp.]
MNNFTNRLAKSTSPYLLQHAHNPVDWYEWGEEALTKAANEHKPILVSIGYSSCHWCHVMERESFEKNDVAQVMNAYFVCIKVDREERPDIDQIYMEAVQALGVNGGWPLNVFLTPDQKPFYGGTYFSPQVWTQVLTNIHNAFKSNRDEIEGTAEELLLHLMNSDVQRFIQPAPDSSLPEDITSIYKLLASKFDTAWGGMDRAPKFVMPSVWRFLLRYYHLTKDDDALRQIKLTLDKICQGGIYDQLRGGFARYSVDGQWIVPHFEKMLYDNGQLLSLYAEAWAVTKDPSYKAVVYETAEWLELEMQNNLGGLYSALDADSEGVEGKYYVWTKKELEQILGDLSPLVLKYYEIKAEGNWEEGVNILYRKDVDQSFLESNNITAEDWNTILIETKSRLLEHRSKRIKPGLDDKVITSWNALTVSGFIDAYMYLSDERFLKMAIRNMEFILSNLTNGLILYRSFKEKRGSVYAFLDDYAFVIQALLKIYQTTFEQQWIDHAKAFMQYTLAHFYDDGERFFHYTGTQSERLIARKKEIFDNVIPSSNAVMAQNLYVLGTMLDNDAWKQMASEMIGGLTQLIKGEPNYMTQWAIALTEIKKGFKEVLMVGPGINQIRREMQSDFRPYAIWMGTTSTTTLPLFEGKISPNQVDTVYVCEQKICKLPVHTSMEAAKQLL